MLAARQHCDVHLCGQIAQAAHILSSAWALEKTPAPYTCDWVIPQKDGVLYNDLKCLRAEVCGNQVYSPRSLEHPCIAWARQYGGNYDWLFQLAAHLLDEYTFRLERLHACAPVIRALEALPPSLLGSIGKYCDSPSLMPAEVAGSGAVESYRNYYRKFMTRALRYTKRRPPEWIADISTYQKESP